MDRSGPRDQHHTESDRANTQISSTWTVMGTGGKDEEAKDQPPQGTEMIKVKAQSSNQARRPNDKEKSILRFSHLTLI